MVGQARRLPVNGFWRPEGFLFVIPSAVEESVTIASASEEARRTGFPKTRSVS